MNYVFPPSLFFFISSLYIKDVQFVWTSLPYQFERMMERTKSENTICNPSNIIPSWERAITSGILFMFGIESTGGIHSKFKLLPLMRLSLILCSILNKIIPNSSCQSCWVCIHQITLGMYSNVIYLSFLMMYFWRNPPDHLVTFNHYFPPSAGWMWSQKWKRL